MASVNKAIIIGNLGRDPEARNTTSGTAVCNFSVATTFKEDTEWHKVVAFGRLAEICGEYLHKGKQVYIEGRLQTREWEDKDGNRRFTTEIVAQTMQMLGPKGAGSDPFISDQYTSREQISPNKGEVMERMYEKPPEGGFDDDLDSLPF